MNKNQTVSPEVASYTEQFNAAAVACAIPAGSWEKNPRFFDGALRHEDKEVAIHLVRNGQRFTITVNRTAIGNLRQVASNRLEGSIRTMSGEIQLVGHFRAGYKLVLVRAEDEPERPQVEPKKTLSLVELLAAKPEPTKVERKARTDLPI